MPTRSLTLTPSSTPFALVPTGAFRITIVASNPVGMPAEIFAYLPDPPLPQGLGSPTAPSPYHFSHVCSPADLNEYPIGASFLDVLPPFFRLNTVDIVFRSRGEALETLSDIEAEFKNLLAALDALDVLEALAPITYTSGGS